jgi:biotin carboxyl carrier protein
VECGSKERQKYGHWCLKNEQRSKSLIKGDCFLLFAYFWTMSEEYHVNRGEKEYQISFMDDQSVKGTINGSEFNLDISKTNTGYHVIQDGKGHMVDVVSVDTDNKQVTLRIDNKLYSFSVKDKYDLLLDKLGMNFQSGGAVSEIKAPMPGLVLDVLVKEGDDIQADQPLIILEAMKMENVIKAPANNSVKNVEVTKGDSVEKNQILISFS